MPPQIALLISLLLIVYLLRRDRKRIEGISNAVWIPFIWMFLSGSRYVSQWLDLSTPSGSTILEGSPVDRAVFTLLIVAGVLVLRKRKLDWNAFLGENPWIWLYFLFGAISFIWSDYPFVSFKRWIKALGTVVMVLVILTEERPYAAIGVILRRLAFVLLPLSVVFIKYYPHLGRAYHSYSGSQMFTGVADTKNGLGVLCLISGVYFSWNLLLAWRDEKQFAHQLHYSIYLVMVPLVAWLLYMSNSATAWVCMVVAAGLFWIGGRPGAIREPQMIMKIGFVVVAVLGFMEIAFDIKDTIIAMLGRRPDLTTRVPMWEDLLSMVRNPLLGFGYESFWLGPRLDYMREEWGIGQQAHNGYLEMYLNMGIVGVCFIGGWIVSGLIKVNRLLTVDYPVAVLRLCLIVIVVLYNWTEATFFGNSNMWLLFFLGIMDVPGVVRKENVISRRNRPKRLQ